MHFYFAHSDTLTPIIVEVLCFVLNIIMILILMRYLSLGGIALATSLSKSIKVGVLLGMLRKKIGYVGLNRFPLFVGQLGVAALVMVVSISLVSAWLNPILDLSTLIGQAFHLSASLGIGGTAFLAAAFLTGVDEIKMIPQRLLAEVDKKKKIV